MACVSILERFLFPSYLYVLAKNCSLVFSLAQTITQYLEKEQAKLPSITTEAHRRNIGKKPDIRHIGANIGLGATLISG